MQSTKRLPAFVIGLALFSMFFGSGNLIFPLFLGKIGLDKWTFASLGFVLTGVLFPFAGVVTMVVYEGDYVKFFNSIGKHLGFVLTIILLTTWIPLGSSPRCIALAHASISAMTDKVPPIWAFSLAYCFFVFLVVSKRSRILDVLGYFLTPILLICLGIIIFKGIMTGSGLGESSYSSGGILYKGILEGYNTMDLIASFFFSASIIAILKQTCCTPKGAVKLAMKSCIFGVSILAVVYLGMIFVAAKHALAIEGVPKEQLLAHLAKVLLHSKLSAVAVFAVVIACFTTSVAMVVVYADFLSESILGGKGKEKFAIYLTLAITFVMSLFGLHGITAVTSPVLQVAYPILIVLMVFNLIRKAIKNARHS